MIGEADSYRIDRVRVNTGLIRKVFDKTLLDMERLKTVELIGQDVAKVDPDEAANLIRRGDQIYVQFRFTDPPVEPEKKEEPDVPETTSIILKGIDRSLWRRFESTCARREGIRPAEKIKKLIRDYNRQTDDKC